jgi:1,4-dihydroxy-2-naphthoate octaprenyltransferase
MRIMDQPFEITPWRAWLLAIRPKTLPAAISPVLVGMALAVADDGFSPLPALAALFGALLIQIGTNLSNDYFDYVKGVDTSGREGPTRVAQSGLITLDSLRVGIILTFATAALVGLYLILVGGWPIAVIGVASLVSALAYTGGPFPIGYHGLGDLFVFIFFGLAAVIGTYYVQVQSLSPVVMLAAIPIGTLTVAILVVNNLRDIETDRQTGKRTLAVIIGAQRTRLEYVLLLAVAYSIPVLLWLVGWTSAWVMLPWLTLPLVLRLAHTIHRTREAPALNQALGRTANLDLLFSLLFALGLIL